VRYVVELTLSGPQAQGASQPENAQPRVEAVVVEAENVPQAIEAAKSKFRDFTITNVTIRFR
jgi:hypothetical protein